jgi:hypothetical protein
MTFPWRSRARLVSVFLASLGCSAEPTRAPVAPLPAGRSVKTAASGTAATPVNNAGKSTAGASPLAPDANGSILARFEARRKQLGELDYPELVRRFGVESQPDAPLRFDPTRVKYFDLVRDQLKLTPAERALYSKQGVVSVNLDRRLSMGSAYALIFEHDLPILVTTDSILHAFHRSYDDTLEELEQSLFTETIELSLTETQNTLVRLTSAKAERDVTTSAADVDLYLTVARNLLAGAGAPADEPPDPAAPPAKAAPAAGLAVKPRLAREDDVKRLIANIASLTLQPIGSPCTAIYGGRRCIDYSQFRPRGHYNGDVRLRRYFRTLMWLGRVDLGFVLREVDPAAGLQVDVNRERRNAALAALAFRESGTLPRLQAVAAIIDFMVGRSDNVSIDELAAALDRAGIKQASDLGGLAALDGIDAALVASNARGQQVRSQVLDGDTGSQKPTDLPLTFQIFGQRFTLDAFALSRLVYDSIVYQNEKQRRTMPSGLDVMAAFGNDDALKLLEPELRRFNYSANLAAMRELVNEHTPADWNQNVYTGWLAALRSLDDAAPPRAHFPASMRREPWRKKQLQTALASWAELRRDTILYAKQSYTTGILCEYPAGYVEPYPAFFERMRDLARGIADRLAAADVSHPDAQRGNALSRVRDDRVTFFRAFAETQRTLADIATKELAGKPFTTEELKFLKNTLVVEELSGGCGGPDRTFSGWYPSLILGNPVQYEPVIADVHTDPNTGHFLEQATGDVNLVVVAVDGAPHRAAYVGPAYSYYEFSSAKRLTDEEWKDALQTEKAPPRPAWTQTFQAPADGRSLGTPPGHAKPNKARRGR